VATFYSVPGVDETTKAIDDKAVIVIAGRQFFVGHPSKVFFL